MKQTILGLDIGTAFVKGLRLSQGFRGRRLLDVFEMPVEMGETAAAPDLPLGEGQIAVLKELVETGRIKKSDLIALSLPGELISTHPLTLPFTDLKKIDQIAAYEVEGELPFDLETVTVDYMLLQNRPGPALEAAADFVSKKESRLLVFALQNDVLKSYLGILHDIGIDPAWIGVNPLSLSAYAKYFLGFKREEGESETLIIDVGAARTVLCHLRGAALNWVRTIPFGGDGLTETLVSIAGLSRAAAEKKKTEIDLNMDDPTDEQSIIELEALEKGISVLALEIEKSIRIFSPESKQDVPEALQQSDKNPVRRYFHLCGGGSRLKGFESQLAKNLEMQPIGVKLEKGSRAAGIAGIERLSEEDIAPVYAQAFGLALQDAEGPPVNFRRGEFVFGKETIERRHRFVSLGLIVLFLLTLMGADLYLHYQKKETRYLQLKNEVRTAFTEIFPDIRNVVNEVSQTKTAITEREQTGAFLGVGEKSPLLILQEITQAIPEAVKIDVFDLVIDNGSIRIQAQTDSFESVDRIRSGLLAANQFKQVEMSDAKVAANKAHVRFRIKMRVQDTKS